MGCIAALTVCEGTCNSGGLANQAQAMAKKQLPRLAGWFNWSFVGPHCLLALAAEQQRQQQRQQQQELCSAASLPTNSRALPSGQLFLSAWSCRRSLPQRLCRPFSGM